ncbi:MAG: cobyrinate a,c-diamide synthase [Isosphaeraceae bacterium]
MTRRLVIAGTSSGVGKTTIVAGLIADLRRRSLAVQPFKVGPDYIDPTYHSLAAGRPCRNLDSWLLPEPAVIASFRRGSLGADIAAIEGVMGLHDGRNYHDDAGSTASVARLLAAPVILVIDVGKMARSAGAVALGFQKLDPDVPLAGFILNRVGGEGHGRGAAGAVERATGLPVFGWLPRLPLLALPERHLGLVPAREQDRCRDFIRAAGDAIARHIDVDRLLSSASSGPIPLDDSRPETDGPSARLAVGSRPVIACARDEAFQFTYHENLELLEEAGAQIAFFSPLHDAGLPDGAAGLILSGGFPEIHAERLSANGAMREAVRVAHARRLPIYAECGGLMYLTGSIVDQDGHEHPMIGLLPGRSSMTGRLTLGYREATAACDSWLFRAGESIRGHEFHYSSWTGRGDDLPAALILDDRRVPGGPTPEGACVGSLWASYVHLHFGSRPELAARFVDACRAAARADTPSPVATVGRWA